MAESEIHGAPGEDAPRRTKRLNALWVTKDELAHFHRVTRERHQKAAEAMRSALQRDGLLPGGEGENAL